MAKWINIIFKLSVIGGILGILYELAFLEYTFHIGFGWTELNWGEWLWENTIGRIK